MKYVVDGYSTDKYVSGRLNVCCIHCREITTHLKGCGKCFEITQAGFNKSTKNVMVLSTPLQKQGRARFETKIKLLLTIFYLDFKFYLSLFY